MTTYIIHQYTPKRLLGSASFDEQDISRKVLDFKDGRNHAKSWAAREVAARLIGSNVEGCLFVCIPAASDCANRRRYARFSAEVSARCGLVDAFCHVSVVGKRTRCHIDRSQPMEENTVIDGDFFRGREVVLFDDILTTGMTSTAFAQRLTQAGAKVRARVFLARTARRWCG